MEMIILLLVLAGAGYAIYRSSRRKAHDPVAIAPDELEKPANDKR